MTEIAAWGGLVEIAIGAVLALFGAILGIQGWFLRSVWATKADRLEVERRPTRTEVEEMIRVATVAWHKLDVESDEARLAPLTAEFKSAEAHRNEQHQENLGRLDKLDSRQVRIEDDIKTLLGRGGWSRTEP